jgi:hypothetical protein
MTHIIDFSKILPAFCAVRCYAPSVFGNGNPSVKNPRILFIEQLLNELGIPFEIDHWTLPTGRPIEFTGENEAHFYNFYLRGTSRAMVMAHHDIVNPQSDNCNDNSASVINAIAAKILNPNLTVVITDCEEFGGKGSHRTCQKIKEGHFGQIDYVVNLELTAVGGTSFFTEMYPTSPLFQKIQSLFPNTPTLMVPFHDGMIVRGHGIDSLVLNPLPRVNGKLKTELLSYCHSLKDSITLANYQDMDDFVRYVVTPLVVE